MLLKQIRLRFLPAILKHIRLVLPALVFVAIFLLFFSRFFSAGMTRSTWVKLAVLLFAGWGVGWLTQKQGPLLWFDAGVLVLAGLLVPTSTIVDGVWNGEKLEPILFLGIYLWPIAALLLSAYLLYTGLRLWTISGIGRTPWFCFGLALALAGKAVHNYYGLLLWDRTTDSIDFLWLILPAVAAMAAGLDMHLYSKGKARLAGIAFAVAIPVLLWAVYLRTQQVDFRAYTNAQAAKVERSLDAFHARAGRYPQSLDELVPFYAFPLPSPLQINGADWCYDGGADYYRLGYVYRDHWSSPNFNVKTAASQGQPPTGLPPLCADQVEWLEHVYSNR